MTNEEAKIMVDYHNAQIGLVIVQLLKQDKRNKVPVAEYGNLLGLRDSCAIGDQEGRHTGYGMGFHVHKLEEAGLVKVTKLNLLYMELI